MNCNPEKFTLHSITEYFPTHTKHIDVIKENGQHYKTVLHETDKNRFFKHCGKYYYLYPDNTII